MTLLAQPTAKPPGFWALNNQPLPASEWVARRATGSPPYGLFAYLHPYKTHRQAIGEVGWRYFRFGGAWTDEDFVKLIEDGAQCTVHVGTAKNRAGFSSDEEFLDAQESRARSVLGQYGSHRGGFYERFPQYRDQPCPIVGIHVWNEPNFNYMIPGPITPELQEARARLYGRLLLRVSKASREVAPELAVLGFETGRAMPNATDFIRRVYQLYPSVHDAYDVLALHPGVHPVPPEADNVNQWGDYSIARHVDTARTILRRQQTGQGKPIWFTEGGWPISQSDGGQFYTAPQMTVPPILQAAYQVRYVLLALRLGVERMAPFFVVDADGNNGGFIDDPKKQKRQSALALEHMIGKMPRPAFLEALHDGPDLFLHAFEPDRPAESPPVPTAGGRVLVAWNVSGPAVLEVSLPAAPKITDMLGASIQMTANPDQRYRIEIGPCPVYIE